MATPSKLGSTPIFQLPQNLVALKTIKVYPENRKSVYSAGDRVRFNFNVAPNQYVWGGKSRVNCTSNVTCTYVAGASNAVDYRAVNIARLVAREWGASCFNYSRELVNNSLPLLDNSNSRYHLTVNNLRALFANSPASIGRYPHAQNDAANIRPSLYTQENLVLDREIDRLCEAGYRSLYKDSQSVTYQRAAGTTDSVVQQNPQKPGNYKIPLGFYSDLANATTYLPVGLMGVQSSNQWTLELGLNDLDRHVLSGFGNDDPSKATVSVNYDNIYIDVVLIEVLSPEIQSQVLQLYEQVPQRIGDLGEVRLALRTRQIGHRVQQFAITSGRSDYIFRVNTTDKSVRAISWIVTLDNRYPTGSAKFNEVDKHYCYSIASNLRCTRLHTKVGQLCIQDSPVQDDAYGDSEVEIYVQDNIKRARAVFSPFPFADEVHSPDMGCQEVFAQLSGFAEYQPIGSTDFLNTYGVNYGAVSFDNMEHGIDESEHVSGVDCSQYGGIDVHMRWQEPINPITSTNADLAAPSLQTPVRNYTITFLVAYDQILQINPSRVADVSQSELS
jgi:hypothetical protein